MCVFGSSIHPGLPNTMIDGRAPQTAESDFLFRCYSDPYTYGDACSRPNPLRIALALIVESGTLAVAQGVAFNSVILAPGALLHARALHPAIHLNHKYFARYDVDGFAPSH
jgi:hypothetical protein